MHNIHEQLQCFKEKQLRLPPGTDHREDGALGIEGLNQKFYLAIYNGIGQEIEPRSLSSKTCLRVAVSAKAGQCSILFLPKNG